MDNTLTYKIVTEDVFGSIPERVALQDMESEALFNLMLAIRDELARNRSVGIYEMSEALINS